MRALNDEPTQIPTIADSGSGVDSWLSLDNTTKAVENNPQLKSDLTNYLSAGGDTRSAAQWLFDDLTAGDTNTYFQDQVKQAGTPSVNSLFPGITDIFSNPSVTAPTGLGNNTPTGQPPEDNSGLLGQITSLFNSLFANLSRPNNTTTIAPVTTTNVSETVNVDNSVANYDQRSDSRVTTTNVQQGYGLDDILNFVQRLPQFLSVPTGNDILSPATPAYGFAQNVAQSGPRIAGQSVASVSGLGANAKGLTVGGLGIPWKTLIIGAILSVIAFILYKRIFK